MDARVTRVMRGEPGPGRWFMEAMGPRIRRMRRRLGFTLDELAAKTSISKPYLSLIETGRVPNPPSDEKLRRLETTLGIPSGELVTQAHLQRTPRDVRAVLQRLIQGSRVKGQESAGKSTSDSGGAAGSVTLDPRPLTSAINLDDAYLSGVLHQMVDHYAGNVEPVRSGSVPVINRVSAGYPRDFTDLSYPPKVADEYVSCPDVNDTDAFAARVHGDSMTPKYREGDIVVFSPAAAPKDGSDCFVRFADGQTTFKRAFFENAEGKDLIRLQPRNEKYAPKTVPAEEITGLYKAVYRYQRVDEE
jgi:repressor LexA